MASEVEGLTIKIGGEILYYMIFEKDGKYWGATDDKAIANNAKAEGKEVIEKKSLLSIAKELENRGLE